MMNKSTLYLVFGALTFGLLVNSFFIVSEKERAIVFQFGEAVRPCLLYTSDAADE